MQTYTKDSLIEKLKEIKNQGWIKNARPGNVGGIGNTIEDLLGIEENNLPIPNASEWELKCQREDTTSLTTLFHMEPSPRALRFVPQILLPNYGWSHKEAGKKYSENEMSFRQTISSGSRSDRGFNVYINHCERKVEISFDCENIDEVKHLAWKKSIEKRVGLGELDPKPYWGFNDLFHKAGTKLKNCFYVQAKRKIKNGEEYFNYDKIYILEDFSIEKFITGIKNENVYVDFDARTGHNHGTKFRIKQNKFHELYDKTTLVE